MQGWNWRVSIFLSLECLKALGHMEMAAQSYTKVVQMAPLHLEARLSLATLQQQLGRPEHALKALESMYDSETLAQDSSASQKVNMCGFFSSNISIAHLWILFPRIYQMCTKFQTAVICVKVLK